MSRTRRLVVAAENRVFGGFVREIQGAMAEAFPGVPTRSVGQKNVPAIAQSLVLEDATILTKHDVVSAVDEVVATRVSGSGGWSFVPSRYFIS